MVWIAGGLLKGARVDDLVAEVAPRLSGAVLLGRDAGDIADALARHAPQVPVVVVDTGDDEAMTDATSETDTSSVRRAVAPGADGPAAMRVVVREAAALASPGETVLLAPAAASLDMFADYAERGRSFASAVEELRGGGTQP